ncbi:MAG: GDP-mannose 4,6-dehydratase, partial [Gammaproteobacteria bacterium]|nr:GDP-mannose 4,6-dehydratase [Gammaproteobacteria bacterium]
WGHARDYVEAQWLMLQQERPEDLVIATNEQHSVREFLEAAAREMDMPITWQGSGLDEQGVAPDGRVIVRVNERYFRPAEVDSLRGDAAKAREKLNWQPKVSFNELVSEMAAHDLALAKRVKHG